ncbi:hypothetical protein MKEN_00205500 [Mycena kentingensis (nom. inval.)]|nr:hypothetical protein MKEN_00205500 [Mycena kentingensis (nom. inval.)]
MSAQITVDSDPSTIQTAFQAKAAQDPVGTNTAVCNYLASSAVRERLVQEATDGLEAIRSMQASFTSVYALLCQVDLQKFTIQGKVIQALAPTWRGYSDRFTDYLSDTEALAAEGRALVQTFKETVLDTILLNNNVSMVDKVKRTQFYVDEVNGNTKTINDTNTLIANLAGLSADVTAFKVTFDTTMADAGKSLTDDIKSIKESLEVLRAKLKAYQESAGMLTKATEGVGITAGVLIVTGGLAPIGLLAAAVAVILGGFAIDATFNKVAGAQAEVDAKEKALEIATAQKATYDKLAPEMAIASADMLSITDKLAVLSKVKSDLIQANTHLNRANNAGQKTMDADELSALQLASKVYDALGAILETFANGWDF